MEQPQPPITADSVRYRGMLKEGFSTVHQLALFKMSLGTEHPCICIIIFVSLEPPTCSLTVTQEQVGSVTSLICQGDGVPLPKVTNWAKNSKPLPVDSDFQVKPGKSSHQEQLDIKNFGMAHLGVYECFVSNKVGSSSCAINIRGKDHTWYIS